MNRLRRSFSRLSLALWLALAAAPARPATLPPGFAETPLVDGTFANGAWLPTAAAFEPGTGNLFVLEKVSRVRVRDAVSGAVSTAIDLPCVDARGERGLLGIAFPPDYLDPEGAGRFVYIYYTRSIDAAGCALAGVPAGTRFQVSRFVETSGALHSEEVILIGEHLTSAQNHNAGAIQFAADGTLFVATGDNDTDGSPNPLSRDLGDLRGKLLRIHPDGSIPADNPFVGQPGVREEIWAYGLRNPFRFRFDPETEAPIIADVGEGTWEAIYAGIPGADYGYPCFQGSAPYLACNPAPAAGAVTDPIFEYGHQGQTDPVTGNSVTGGPVYRDTQFPPDYRDRYYFGDYGAHWIFRARFAADGRLVDPELFASNAAGVVDLLVAPNGCMVWVSIAGQGVNEICFVGGANGQPVAAASATPVWGQAPLNVAFSGSSSSDPDLDPLTYDWDFGDLSGSTAADPAHLYSDNGIYQAVLTVDDGQGEANSQDDAPPIKIVVGNRAPSPAISLPGAGASYDAGDTIAFSGSATDPEEGALAASRLSWTVVFHHGTHTHPFLGPVTGVSAGSFEIPTAGEDATDVFYRVHLTATDTGIPLLVAGSLAASTFVDVTPNLADITLAATPPGAGLELELDRQPQVAPLTEPSVVNFPRTLGAPSPQTTGSGTFFFQSWSDGGAAEHGIATPPTDTTYTATYAACAAGVDDLVRDQQDVSTEVTETACLTITLGNLYRLLDGGMLTLNAGVAAIFENGVSFENGGLLTVDLTPPI